MHEDIIDPVVRARADILHAEKALSEWLNHGRERSALTDCSAAIGFLRRAHDSLDTVIERVVKKANDHGETGRSPRRPGC
jgi:hypothetical protein